MFRLLKFARNTQPRAVTDSVDGTALKRQFSSSYPRKGMPVFSVFTFGISLLNVDKEVRIITLLEALLGVNKMYPLFVSTQSSSSHDRSFLPLM